MRTSPWRRTPLAIGVLAAIGVAFIVVPIAALLIRAPWSHLVDQLSSTGASTALRLSLEVSLAAATPYLEELGCTVNAMEGDVLEG